MNCFILKQQIEVWYTNNVINSNVFCCYNSSFSETFQFSEHECAKWFQLLCMLKEVIAVYTHFVAPDYYVSTLADLA